MLVSLAATAGGVYVMPVEREIDMQAFRHLRRGLAEAREHGADLFLVRLNTFGGALDAADSMRTALMRCTIPTVAFVDLNAASAGALIALACDSVYMAPGASMGSATVVNGQGEPMPAKYQSYMATIMRSTAEWHGKVLRGDSMVWRRSPELAASMVNPEVSVSLTAGQAVAEGYAEGIAPDVPDVLADLNMAGAEVTTYLQNLSEDILGFLSNAAVRAILVMLILGGIYMEMHTPGLGFAAAVSTVSAILFFLPMFVSGAMPAWIIICLIAGIVLIALEVFVIPGFGVTGITGILCVCAALLGAMMSSDAVSGFDLGSLGRAFVNLLVGAGMAAAIIWYLTSSHGPKWMRSHSELMTELSTSDGFVGVDMRPAELVGHHGRSVTVLRPAGKIDLDGEIYDAVSTGAFIEPDRKVKVVRYENAQLYVEEA